MEAEQKPSEIEAAHGGWQIRQLLVCVAVSRYER